MKIYCLIPAFDETGNLIELCQRLTAVFKNNNITYKILLVIQGDKKGRELVKKMHVLNKRIDYIYYPKALGIGRAYNIAFNEVNSYWTHVLTMDADLNHQPEEFPKLLQAYKKTHSELIIGSRFIQGGKFKDKRLWKIVTSKLVNLIINKILDVSILDKTSGYRLIRSSLIIKIRNLLKEKGYPSYMELLFLTLKNGSTVYEVPITYVPRTWGKSKMGKLKTSIDYLMFLVKLIFYF